MYAHKLVYLCRDTDRDDQVNDIAYKKIQYAYVTYVVDESGKYDPKDKSKLRSTSGVVVLDAVNANNFVSFNNVTPEILTNWIKQKINESELQNLNIQQFNK